MIYLWYQGITVFSTCSYNTCLSLSTSYEDQFKSAIEHQDLDAASRLLPCVRHQSTTLYNVRDYLLRSWWWKVPCKTNLMHICALLGWKMIVQQLVFLYKYDPRQTDVAQYTPLHYAALGGHLHIIQYFVQDCGVNPMSKGTSNTVPPTLGSILG